MATAARRAHVLNRLKSIDGHLRGVIRMVEDDTYCIDVIRQLQAVEGAIGRVASLMLEDHLQTCVTSALRGDDADDRTRVISELLRLFEAGARTTGDDADGAGTADALRAQTHLGGRLLAGHEQRRRALRDRRERHGQQRRLADARLAAEQDERARHDAAAEHAVELAEAEIGRAHV